MVNVADSWGVIRLLRALRVLLVAAIPVTALLMLRTSPPPAPAAGALVVPEGPPLAEATRGLDWYAPLWERDLRQPPIPPTPAAPQRPAAPRESLPKLVTTFVETDHRYAHFLDAQGKMRFCAVDERIGAYRVAAIESGRARLIDGAYDVWVEMPKPEKP